MHEARKTPDHDDPTTMDYPITTALGGDERDGEARDGETQPGGPLQAGGPRDSNHLGPPSHLPPLPDRRDVLGRAGGENFPVAFRVLPPQVRTDLFAIYGFARLVDQLGDAYAGDRLGALSQVEAQLDRAFRPRPGAGVPLSPPQPLSPQPYSPSQPVLPTHPLVGAAISTVESTHAEPTALYDLVEANRRDQTTSRYRTFADLAEYCRYSANPVGRLVLSVFGYSAGRCDPRRLQTLSAWSDAICTALQVAEHCQDVREDALVGRVYLPSEDLARFGVDPDQLTTWGPAGSALRGLIAFEVARARELLIEGEPLVGALQGWGRLAVAGFVAGGHAALDSVADAGFDPLPRSPKPEALRTAMYTARLVLRRRRRDTVGRPEAPAATLRGRRLARRGPAA